jgi:hypothetical protein
VCRDLHDYDIFLYIYVSVAHLSCSDSETFSSELMLAQVQLSSPSESFEAQFIIHVLLLYEYEV